MSADLLARAEAARPGIAQEARDVAMRRKGAFAGYCYRSNHFEGARKFAEETFPWPAVTLPGEPVEVEAEREANVDPSSWRATAPCTRLGVAVMFNNDGTWWSIEPSSPARIRAAAKALDAATSPVTVRVVWHDGVARAEVVG